MFAVHLVQEDTIKMGFSHESVRKQEVFASEKILCYSLSYWWKKAPHQPITKLYGKLVLSRYQNYDFGTIPAESSLIPILKRYQGGKLERHQK